MPYGRSYRKKARRTVRKAKKYARRGGRLGKRLGKKLIGKAIPGYNVYSTADDILWAGNKVYRYLKNRQRVESNRSKQNLMDSIESSRSKQSRGRRKRYGIDDWY